MRLTALLSVVAATLPSAAIAFAQPDASHNSSSPSSNATSAAALLAALPSCAVNCMLSYAPQSSCGLTDVQCLCNDETYNDHVTVCVKASCTVKQSLTTKNVSWEHCGKKAPSKKTLVRNFPIAGAVIATVAVVIRCIARLPYFGGKFGADDWTILVANCCMLALMAIANSGRDGFGNSVWTVSFHGLTTIQKKFYFVEKVYTLAIWITKISILFFYLRIFPERNFRRITYSVIATCSVTCFILLIASIFQCSPVSYSWNAWDGEHQGHCTHVNAQIWANAGINILFDIVVIALPLPQIWVLKISWEKKVGVLFMFGLGALVTIASIIRLQSLIYFARSDNLTYDYVPVSIWSTVEVVVGILVACVPGLRAFYTLVMPRVFGEEWNKSSTTSKTAKSTGQSSGKSTGKYSDKSSKADDTYGSTIISDYMDTQLSYSGSTMHGKEIDEVHLVDVEANRF